MAEVVYPNLTIQQAKLDTCENILVCGMHSKHKRNYLYVCYH